ncbi:MAG: N-acetyltransferase family protein [Vulcanimicrobiaceae bacterium]
MTATPRTYPWESLLGDQLVTFRMMSAADKDIFKDFVRSLPRRDNYYLMLDMHSDQSIDLWFKRVETGQTLSVIALQNDRMIGFCDLHINDVPWIRHTAEMHLNVSGTHRGLGLGRILANEIFAIARARGLEKIWARMAATQEAAQSVFQNVGFHAEALLSDFVKNEDGLTEDLVIMSYDAGELWGL